MTQSSHFEIHSIRKESRPVHILLEHYTAKHWLLQHMTHAVTTLGSALLQNAGGFEMSKADCSPIVKGMASKLARSVICE